MVMSYKLRSAAATMSFVLGTLGLSACGGGLSGIVKGVTVKSRVDQGSGNVLMDITSILEMGRLSFPSLSIPVLDPRNPSLQYGNVTLGRTLDGKNSLILSVDVTEVSRSNVHMERTLPNGTPIPIASATDMVVVPIARAGRLYFDASTNRTLIGAAIVIKEFEQVGSFVPGLNLFFNLPRVEGVTGLAGIFTGRDADQNGVALFFDVTNALPKSGLALSANSEDFRMQSREVSSWEFSAPAVDMRSSRVRKLNNRLYDLSRHRKELTVQ